MHSGRTRAREPIRWPVRRHRGTVVAACWPVDSPGCVRRRSMTAGASSDSGSATDGVLSRLVGELEELGFEPTRPVGCPDETVYTATDSAVVVTVITNESNPHVCVSASRGPDAAWTMHWTATAPVSV